MGKIIMPPGLRLFTRKKKLFLVPRQKFVGAIVETVVATVLAQLNMKLEDLPKRQREAITRRAAQLSLSIAGAYNPPPPPREDPR